MQSKSAPKPTQHPRWSAKWILAEVRGYAEALVIAFVVVTFLFTTVGVVGASMLPTLDGGPGSQNLVQSLLTGDRAFIPKYDTWLRRAGVLGDYQRGEVVVLRPPENSPSAQLTGQRNFFIKRIVGVPGDLIRIEAGQLYVNGVEINQDFLIASGQVTIAPVDFPVITQSNGELTGMNVEFASRGGVQAPVHTESGRYPPPVPVSDSRVQLYFGSTLEALAPFPDDAPDGVPFVHDFIVPDDSYFVLGDNRSPNGSEDSRLFGPIPSISIAGQASAVIWPPRRDGEWNWKSLPVPEAFTLQ